MVLHINVSHFHLVAAVKISNFHRVGAVLLTVLFAMPTAFALPQWMGVGGWGCLISANISRNILPSLIFKNCAPNSASAADEAMSLRTVYNV